MPSPLGPASGLPPRRKRDSWPRRIGWLLLIWCAGVAALALTAGALKLLMRAIGMSA